MQGSAGSQLPSACLQTPATLGSRRNWRPMACIQWLMFEAHACLQVQDTREELADLRQEFRQVNREYNTYLERLRKENGVIKQPGVDHFIFNDPEVGRWSCPRHRSPNALQNVADGTRMRCKMTSTLRMMLGSEALCEDPTEERRDAQGARGRRVRSAHSLL
eukprot:2286584-Rhodomonas_salina.3